MSTVASPHPAAPTASLGLVFTDARGRVVFVDNNFLIMSHQPESIRLVGESFARVVKADANRINELMHTVAQAGFVQDFELALGVPPENPLNVLCTGVANYDEYSAFIGADLTLRDVSAPQAAEESPPPTEVVSRHIQQIEGTAHTQAQKIYEADNVLLQSYFTAQAGALQVLLGRMGGPRVREAVEEMINKHAARNSWPIQVKGGLFVIDMAHTPREAFHAILVEVVDYGHGIVGAKAVASEMQKVDSQMTDRARQLAGDAGLRQVS